MSEENDTNTMDNQGGLSENTQIIYEGLMRYQLNLISSFFSCVNLQVKSKTI